MRFPTLLLAGLTALALAACGDDDESSTGSSSPQETAESAAFPVTVEHKYGSTTIEEAPERVAVVGLREQDALLGLGIVPVATSEWYGEHPGAIFPWAQDELGDAEPPTVLSYKDGIEVEKVAATRPDLIVGVYSGMTKKEYETLSRLAPVVAQPKGLPDYGSSWQQETLMTGQAERGAGGDAEQGPGHPEVRDDRRVPGPLAVAAQRLDHVAERDRAGADGEREQGGEGEPAEGDCYSYAAGRHLFGNPNTRGVRVP